MTHCVRQSNIPETIRLLQIIRPKLEMEHKAAQERETGINEAITILSNDIEDGIKLRAACLNKADKMAHRQRKLEKEIAKMEKTICETQKMVNRYRSEVSNRQQSVSKISKAISKYDGQITDLERVSSKNNCKS